MIFSYNWHIKQGVMDHGALPLNITQSCNFYYCVFHWATVPWIQLSHNLFIFLFFIFLFFNALLKCHVNQYPNVYTVTGFFDLNPLFDHTYWNRYKKIKNRAKVPETQTIYNILFLYPLTLILLMVDLDGFTLTFENTPVRFINQGSY